MGTSNDMDVRRMIEEAVAPLHKRIAELEAQVARLKRNSSNSSKPPSSDITHPPPAGGSGSGGSGGLGGSVKKWRIGGQKGHPKHVRPVFPPEQIDHTLEYELSDLGNLQHPGAIRIVEA